MLEIDRILVPTDFSECSRRALVHAKDLARIFHAEILVVHVMEKPFYPPGALEFGDPSLPVVEQAVRDAIDQSMQRLLSEERRPEEGKSDVAVRGLVKEGRPYLALLEAIETEHIDLVVIATHGHTGLRHVLLGSTAEKLVRKARCPVLTLREPERPDPGAPANPGEKAT